MVSSLCIAGYSCHSYSLSSKVHSIARDCPNWENLCVVGKSSQHQGANIIMSQCPWTWQSKWEDLTLLSRPWIRQQEQSQRNGCVCVLIMKGDLVSVLGAVLSQWPVELKGRVTSQQDHFMLICYIIPTVWGDLESHVSLTAPVPFPRDQPLPLQQMKAPLCSTFSVQTSLDSDIFRIEVMMVR